MRMHSISNGRWWSAGGTMLIVMIVIVFTSQQTLQQQILLSKSSSSSSSSSESASIVMPSNSNVKPSGGGGGSFIDALSRTRRSPFDMIDRSFDAMKCTLKILSTEMSQYHSNRLMCCALWQIKAYLKSSAEERCEKPKQIQEVFDHFINEELIYSPISKSLLGNQNLSCAKYSEGSAVCAGFIFFVKFMLVFAIVLLIFLVCGFAFFCNGFCKYRKKNRLLLEQISLKCQSDSSSTSSSTENNNSSKFVIKKMPNYLQEKGDFNLPKIRPVHVHKHTDTTTADSTIAEIDIESKV